MMEALRYDKKRSNSGHSSAQLEETLSWEKNAKPTEYRSAKCDEKCIQTNRWMQSKLKRCCSRWQQCASICSSMSSNIPMNNGVLSMFNQISSDKKMAITKLICMEDILLASSQSHFCSLSLTFSVLSLSLSLLSVNRLLLNSSVWIDRADIG